MGGRASPLSPYSLLKLLCFKASTSATIASSDTSLHDLDNTELTDFIQILQYCSTVTGSHLSRIQLLYQCYRYNRDCYKRAWPHELLPPFPPFYAKHESP